MRCAIHQPQFLPWLGYLHKIQSVDKFVFLDNVQFRKNEFQNRNRALVAGAARWLTVPVSFRFGATLRETGIAESVPWRKKIMHTLDLNYVRTPYYRQFRDGLEGVLGQDWKTLADLNAASVRWLMKCFDMHTETFTSSCLGISKFCNVQKVGPDSLVGPSEWKNGGTGCPALPSEADKVAIPVAPAHQDDLIKNPTQRLIAICRGVGADTYLSGAGGHNYLAGDEFEKAGIKLEFQEFNHPVYPQIHSSRFTVQGSSSFARVAAEDKQFTEGNAAFVPCLSAIDGLFNCGGGAAGRKMLGIET